MMKIHLLTRQHYISHSGLQAGAGTRRSAQVRHLPEAPNPMIFKDRPRLNTIYSVAGLISTMMTLLLFLGMSTAAMADTAAEDVTASGAYARAVPPGQPNSASFLVLTNKSKMDHALIAASSPVAKVVELHTHTMEGGMMRMRKVEKIDLPAGQATKLQPGGLHIMLIGLHQQLKDGDKVPLTLVFEDKSETRITAPVRKLQMKMMHGMKPMNMQHEMQHKMDMAH